MLAPVLAGVMFASPRTLSFPFFLAGGLKIVYDLMLLTMFRQTKPQEEHVAPLAYATTKP